MCENSVISHYIKRFREAPPISKAHRKPILPGEAFWWLTPSDSIADISGHQSTPLINEQTIVSNVDNEELINFETIPKYAQINYLSREKSPENSCAGDCEHGRQRIYDFSFTSSVDSDNELDLNVMDEGNELLKRCNMLLYGYRCENLQPSVDIEDSFCSGDATSSTAQLSLERISDVGNEVLSSEPHPSHEVLASYDSGIDLNTICGGTTSTKSTETANADDDVLNVSQNSDFHLDPCVTSAVSIAMDIDQCSESQTQTIPSHVHANNTENNTDVGVHNRDESSMFMYLSSSDDSSSDDDEQHQQDMSSEDVDESGLDKYDTTGDNKQQHERNEPILVDELLVGPYLDSDLELKQLWDALCKVRRKLENVDDNDVSK